MYNRIIMKYQKIINLLENTQNQTSTCRTKYWVETNDEVRVMYNKDYQIKFKTSMLKSSLCGYSDTYIHVKGTITVAPAPVPAANPDNNYNNKEEVFN